MVMGRKTFDTVAGMEGGPWPYGDTPVYVVTSQDAENVRVAQHLKHQNIVVEKLHDGFQLKQLFSSIEEKHEATNIYVD